MKSHTLYDTDNEMIRNTKRSIYNRNTLGIKR